MSQENLTQLLSECSAALQDAPTILREKVLTGEALYLALMLWDQLEDYVTCPYDDGAEGPGND